MIYLKKINKCYTVLYNLGCFKDSALSENTGMGIGIEDESCPRLTIHTTPTETRPK